MVSKFHLSLFLFLVIVLPSSGQTANIASPHLDVQGPLYARENFYILNYTGSGWVPWAIRNSTASSTKIDLSNVNTINASGGNVGIGSLTALTKLHVVGEGTFGSNGFGMLRVGTDDGSYLWIRNTTNDRTLRFNTSNTTYDMKTNGAFEWSVGGQVKMSLGFETLPSVATNAVVIHKVATAGGSSGNSFQNTKWLVRDATGSDWLTARLHDAISIDGSYNTPGTSTATWWERDPADNIQSWGNGSQLYMTIKQGKVGIGTNDPDKALTVKGTIHTHEVLVDTDPRVVPDYVFTEEYPLMSLSDTEAYIKTNRHLPEIPSAEEIGKEGMNLKEMNLLMLKKIEELTLHLIAKEKEMSTLRTRLEKLESIKK